MKEYFGLDIFDLEETIIKNRDKILGQKAKTEKMDIGNITSIQIPKMNKLREKKGIFNQCDLCNKWIEVTKEYLCPEDGPDVYFSPLMEALDHSGRWVCSTCWDIIDVARDGPYKTCRPLSKPYPRYLEKLIKR